MSRFYARTLLAAIALLAAVTAQPAMAGPRICVIVPHFKDEYWLSVGFGLEKAAVEAGAELLIHESGGYHSLERQIELLASCMAAGSKAILLGAVSANDPRLLDAVAKTAETVPVLALVNELAAPEIAGWVGVDWRGMGAAVGSFVGGQNGIPTPTAVLVTGPNESGWVPILEQGLTGSLAGNGLEIVATYRADTGLREQLREVERALAEHGDADILIGSAPAIEGAMALLRRLPEGAHRPRLVATYISHSVLRGLRSGLVEMVPFDDPIAQGRLGLQLALRAIKGERFPGLSGPTILPIVGGTADVARISLSPAGYFPSIE